MGGDEEGCVEEGGGRERREGGRYKNHLLRTIDKKFSIAENITCENLTYMYLYYSTWDPISFLTRKINLGKFLQPKIVQSTVHAYMYMYTKNVYSLHAPLAVSRVHPAIKQRDDVGCLLTRRDDKSVS